MFLLPLLAALLAPTQAPPSQVRPISDRQLVAYARRRYDPAAIEFHHVILGTQRGVRVIADFPCSDLCPAETVRIIHLEVEPGPRCTAAGGVVRDRMTPMGIAVGQRPYCVPRVFADGEPSPR